MCTIVEEKHTLENLWTTSVSGEEWHGSPGGILFNYCMLLPRTPAQRICPKNILGKEYAFPIPILLCTNGSSGRQNKFLKCFRNGRLN